MKLPRLFRKKSIWQRPFVQLFFFGLIAMIVLQHSNVADLPWIPRTSLHSVCPFGGVESLYQLITQGRYIQQVRDASFILLGLVLLLSVLFGPVFCGWICPLGSIQEWVGKLGRSLLRRRYNNLLPAGLDAVLRYSRYLILAWVVYVTAQSGRLVFQAYDPYFALFQFWTGEVAPSALLILGLTLGLSLLVERPWCKYACPFGAILGISNLFRVFSIRRMSTTCRAGGVCHIRCPMNIPVDSLDVVRDHQCITCMECTSEACCPVEETVVFATGAYRR